MRRADIFKSTSFRLATVFVSLFLAAYVVANLVAFNLVASYLYERLDSHVMERYREIESAFADKGIEGATAMINNHGPAIRRQETLYSLHGPDGRFLAGNIELQGIAAGLSTLDGSKIENLPGNYRVFRNEMGGNDLVVGVSYDDTNRLRRIAIYSLSWATAIVLVMGFGGAAFLAFRARRRIADLAEVMHQVGAGELSLRLPVSKRMDDIDTFAREVNVSLGHLQTSVVALKQVTTDVAHDLKTPLARLFLMLEEASEGTPDGESRQLVQLAMDEVLKITRTFEALLRIAQIEAGARRDRFETTDLSQVLLEVYEIYADVADQQGRILGVRLPEQASPVQVFGDSELLRQMLANLVQNALRHTHVGARILLGCLVQGDRVRLFVADNGPGIPASEKQKVLERFYRLEKSRSSSGSGLGLSMAKAIAELHGSSVVLLDNRPGLIVRIDLVRQGQMKSPPAEVKHTGGQRARP